MRRAWILAAILLASAACSAASPSDSEAPPEATQEDISSTVGEPEVAAAEPAAVGAASTDDAEAVEATPQEPPTPIATPTPRPTPLPTATPIPPSKEVEPTAANLATKLTAYRTALKGKDLDIALRAGRELLAAVDQGETALKNDKSRQAAALMTTMSNIRAGIVGDNQAMDHADAALRQPTGAGTSGAATSGLVTSGTAATPGVEMSLALSDLADKLRSFRQAVHDHSVESAVRLQGDLLIDLTALERANVQDKSDKGKSLNAAFADLRKGLDGDPNALAAAAQVIERQSGTSAGAAVDIPALALSLSTKLDAFRTASAGGSRDDLLRLQRQILAEADQTTKTLGFDESGPAHELRDAIAATRAAVSGETNKMDGAQKSLAKLAGTQDDAAAALGAPGAPNPITDLPKFASEMEQTIIAFQAAIKKDDTGAMLKLQRDLVDKTDRSDAALKTISTKPAEQMRSANATIRTAFAGDMSKLDEAAAQLRQISGSAAAKSAVPNATGAKTAPQPSQNFDPKAVTNELRNKLNGLKEGVTIQNQTKGQPLSGDEIAARKDDMAKRRSALQAELSKTEDALKAFDEKTTAPMKDVLQAIHEAANGDDAKIDAAVHALDAVTGQPH
ncbi:MAG TPA: hypothetical protein VFC93_00065 [Chloroflexota bacterium]|nr:hypothetical protein [Chloroflexota bacterium]